MEKMEKRFDMENKWLNLNDYRGFQFFLNDRREVKDLKLATLFYGGATMVENGKIYSNIDRGTKVEISTNSGLDNTLSIYLPSTLGSEKAPQKLIDTVLYKLVHKLAVDGYNCRDCMNLENAVGSWFDEENMKIIEEGILIISINLQTIENADIYRFIEYGKYVKKAMKQQAVSIGINRALALI